jgi:hypothetical protein
LFNRQHVSQLSGLPDRQPESWLPVRQASWNSAERLNGKTGFVNDNTAGAVQVAAAWHPRNPDTSAALEDD